MSVRKPKRPRRGAGDRAPRRRERDRAGPAAPPLSPEDEPAPAGDAIAEESFRRILGMLRGRFRIDLGLYKPTTVRRRVLRRMALGGFREMPAYADHLASNVEALQELHDDLFIHVTQFFRDPDAFQALRDAVFPALLQRRDGDPIRVWVPGCSTGEEAYSIAMALTEFLDRRGATAKLQVFATDISDAAVERARRAVYAEPLLGPVGAERVERFFEKIHGGWRIRKELRDACVVSRHDVTSNPPFARLDLVSCRNVLIYFGQSLQERILPVFHYALKPGGFLWLGRSETPGASSKLFHLVDKDNKIFSKIAAPIAQIHLPAVVFDAGKLEGPRGPGPPPSAADLERRADQLLLLKYAPPSVVVNQALEIVQFRGRTTPYLEPAVGPPTHALFRMAHRDLLPTLRPLVQEARKHNAPARRDGLILVEDGTRTIVNLEVAPLNPRAPEAERQLIVLFEEVRPKAAPGAVKPTRLRASARARSAAPDERVAELEREMAALQQRQQTLVEQFESSQEELRSANEELVASNEELQSTNEELETAKEELQSANEELTTMNGELQGRNAELVELNEKLARGEDRFRLMVEGVREYAIYMLDADGRVTSWNEGARRLKGYEASEVVGERYHRFFLPEDVAAGTPDAELERARIEGRLETEGWRRRKDGSPFWANIILTRINDSTGRLVGFSKVTRDLTERKRSDEALHAANEGLEARVRQRTQELERALRARDEFLSIASHELKTPLTALKLQLQMGSRAGATGGAAERVLGKALGQSIALEQLIEDLLDVSRLQTGRFRLEPREIDLSALIEEIAGRFAEQTAQAGSKIELRLERPIAGRWDGRRMTQVLANLISNALKHAPRSAVRIRAARKGAQTEIVVEDDGPGIDEEKQAAIFERFERGGASPSVGGLGLGLFISRRIVEAHEGTIRVESRPGQGARFIVALPSAPSHPDLEADLGERPDHG